MTGLAATMPLAAGLALTLGLTAALVAVAVIDLRTFRIPDRLSLPLIVTGLGLAFLGPQGLATAHLAGAVGAWALFEAIGATHFRLRGTEGLGRGDAKLFAAAGAWLGWQALPLVLLVAAVGGLAQALVSGRARGAAIAFGPWLAFGFWAVWTFGFLGAR